MWLKSPLCCLPALFWHILNNITIWKGQTPLFFFFSSVSFFFVSSTSCRRGLQDVPPKNGQIFLVHTTVHTHTRKLATFWFFIQGQMNTDATIYEHGRYIIFLRGRSCVCRADRLTLALCLTPALQLLVALYFFELRKFVWAFLRFNIWSPSANLFYSWLSQQVQELKWGQRVTPYNLVADQDLVQPGQHWPAFSLSLTPKVYAKTHTYVHTHKQAIKKRFLKSSFNIIY